MLCAFSHGGLDMRWLWWGCAGVLLGGSAGLWAFGRTDPVLPGLDRTLSQALAAWQERTPDPDWRSRAQAWRADLQHPLLTQALQASWPPPALPERAPQGRWVWVTDVAALRTAFDQAQAGDVIELQAGDYPIAAYLQTPRAGRAAAPIVLRGRPGARLLAQGVMALKLTQPYWVIEGLHIEGRCRNPADCEHAMQVAGDAHHSLIQANRLLNFNAAIKVNGERGRWPDHGRVQGNWLENQAPRPGDAPTVAFDLVGASAWTVEDNTVLGYVKGGGDHISYALFMKGGGQGGRFLRNRVVCAPRPGFQPGGFQIGISFGGGLTDPKLMRPNVADYEHLDGLAEGNTVLNCNDSSFDVNQSAGVVLRGNRFLGGGGVTVRGKEASAHAEANVGSAALHARRGNRLSVVSHQRWRPETEDAQAALAELPQSPATSP
ncbi:MAG: chondroitinase-B domain-containing protein [Inhella sp.]